MHDNAYDVFYSQFSHQNVPTTIEAIFRVKLLQDYKGTNVFCRVVFTPWQVKITIISVKII